MMLSQPQSDAIRAIIARDAESNPRLAALLRDLATIPVPTAARERTWARIQSIRREPDERTSVTCLHHIPAEITGSVGALHSFQGVTTSPAVAGLVTGRGWEGER